MTDYTTPPPPPPPGPPGGFPPPPPPPGPPGGFPPPGPPGGFPPPPGGGYGAGPSSPQNGFGIAALVTGILSIPGICCCGLGLPLGIAGVVLGFLGMKKADAGLATNKPLALTGLITGAVGIVLTLIVLIWWAAAGSNPVDYSKFNTP